MKRAPHEWKTGEKCRLCGSDISYVVVKGHMVCGLFRCDGKKQDFLASLGGDFHIKIRRKGWTQHGRHIRRRIRYDTTVRKEMKEWLGKSS